MSRRTDLYREALDHETRQRARIEELLAEIDKVEKQKDVLQAAFVRAQTAAADAYARDIAKLKAELGTPKVEPTIEELGESYIRRLRRNGAPSRVLDAAEKAVREAANHCILSKPSGHRGGYCEECSLEENHPVYHDRE